ncbi:MAG: helix-turn-helix transcriptional regulator, partial [Candidatus Binataceae bacterium]
MAAARETEEAVNSGSESESGNKAKSGRKSRDATEAASNQAKPDGETKPAAAIKTESADAAPSSSSAEAQKAGADSEPSLGKTLAAARERRGVSRADVVAETRIPAHYLEMIESSDYGLISDQLYLMPFLRRYAAFLNLDGEEVAMRFVREVQRAEVAAVPRMSEPLALHDRKRAPWGRVAAVIIVLSAIVVLYIIASEHHRGEFGFHQPSPPAAPAAPNGAIPPAVAPAPIVPPAPMVAPAPMAAPA